MRFRYLLLLPLAALSASACDDDTVTDSTPAPAALVRFVNANVDTGTVDFRFVDRVENLPTFLGVPFRGSSGLYQRVGPGTRPVRIFPNSSNQALASIRLVDKTITLEADKRYTLVYAGRAAGNQDTLVVIEDDASHPTPSGTNIAVKTLHVAVGTGAVDVYIGNSGTDPVAAPVARTNSVAYLARSAYVTIPARSGSGNLYTFAVAPTGSGTASFSATPNQPGAPSTTPTVGPQPGVQIAGSVLTAVVFAGATPGTRSATATNTTPSVTLLIDKALNP
jgi:hypothetical protein